MINHFIRVAGNVFRKDTMLSVVCLSMLDIHASIVGGKGCIFSSEFPLFSE